MIPVDQTQFGNGDDPKDKRLPGNCFEACVASLLEIPLEEAPYFGGHGRKRNWWGHLIRWLRPRGLVPIFVLAEHYTGSAGFVIASGVGHRGVRHCVVLRDEEMVHDPHPNRGGLKEISSYVFFGMLDPARTLKEKRSGVEIAHPGTDESVTRLTIPTETWDDLCAAYDAAIAAAEGK